MGKSDIEYRRQNADRFVDRAEGYGVSIERKTYPHTGHSYTSEMEDDFIRFLTE